MGSRKTPASGFVDEGVVDQQSQRAPGRAEGVDQWHGLAAPEPTHRPGRVTKELVEGIVRSRALGVGGGDHARDGAPDGAEDPAGRDLAEEFERRAGEGANPRSRAPADPRLCQKSLIAALSRPGRALSAASRARVTTTAHTPLQTAAELLESDPRRRAGTSLRAPEADPDPGPGPVRDASTPPATPARGGPRRPGAPG